MSEPTVVPSSEAVLALLRKARVDLADKAQEWNGSLPTAVKDKLQVVNWLKRELEIAKVRETNAKARTRAKSVKK